MKNLILILGITMLALTSCKKDDIKPKVEQFEDCNCGIVVMIEPIDSVRNAIKLINNCNNGIKYTSTIDLDIGLDDEFCTDKPW